MVLVTCSGFPGRGTIIGGAMAPLAPPLSTSLGSTSGIINQDIDVAQKNKYRKTYEKIYVVIINLFKSYFMNIEAKTNLGNCKRGSLQFNIKNVRALV